MSKPQRTLLAVLVIALLAVIAISVFHDDDQAASAPGAPEIVSPAELADFAAESGREIYWIGPRSGARYELTDAPQGRIYVRYLRGGAEAGDERADFVTVATYPAEDAVARLRQAARDQPGAELGRTADGAVLLTEPSSPLNAYVAYPGADLQVEVFSPLPDHARRLAARGEVQRVP